MREIRWFVQRGPTAPARRHYRQDAVVRRNSRRFGAAGHGVLL